jgi:hypothetical protein
MPSLVIGLAITVGICVGLWKLARLASRKGAGEVQRTCRRDGTVWFAPKGGVFTRKQSVGDTLVASTTVGLVVKSAEASREQRCPTCGSQEFDQIDA